MKSLNELVSDKRLSKEKDRELDRLAGSIHKANAPTNQNMVSVFSQTLSELHNRWEDLSIHQQEQLSELMASMVENMPKPEMSINLNGMGRVTLDGVEKSLEGLTSSVLKRIDEKDKAHMKMMEKYHEAMSSQMEAIIDAVSDMSISVPEIKIPRIEIPQINVPQPKVTVNAPAPTIIREEEPEDKQVSFEAKRDKFGQLVEIIEVYESGKVTTKKENGTWTIDDRRKKTT